MRAFMIAGLAVLWTSTVGWGASATPPVTPPTSVTWQNDLELALGQAEKEGKMTLLFFHASWCGWCKRMDSETFVDASFVKFMKSNYIASRIDVEEHEAIAKRFDAASALPTVVILESRGRTVGVVRGYRAADKMLEILTQIGTLNEIYRKTVSDLKKDPKNAELILQAAELEVRGFGWNEEGIRRLDRAIVALSSNTTAMPKLYLLRATAFVQISQFEAAMHDLNIIMQDYPDHELSARVRDELQPSLERYMQASATAQGQE